MYKSYNGFTFWLIPLTLLRALNGEDIPMRPVYNYQDYFVVITIALFAFLLPGKFFGQEPTTQDCLGAIPVCDFEYEDENDFC